MCRRPLALVGLLSLGLLAACNSAPSDAPAAATAPVIELGWIEAALPAPKPPADVPDLLPAIAIDLIVEFEIGSSAHYDKRLQSPYWPGHQSGVTVGIGDDLGFKAASVILQDWHAHSERARLAQQAGFKGASAKARIPSLADIRITYTQARAVFDSTTIVNYYRIMRRAFPGAEQLHPVAQGVLTSLVYNRGASMRGDDRAEMRTIRDSCVPAFDYDCMARAIRQMVRVWRNSSIERGMERRRNAEAALLEQIA